MITKTKTSNNRFITNKRITFFIFFTLLSCYFIGSFYNKWLSEEKVLGYWIGISYLFIEYILCSITIWLNSDNLNCLNVDSSFIIIFILTGVLISFSLPLIMGVFLGLVTVFNYRNFSLGNFKIERHQQNRWQVFALVIISLIPPIYGIWRSGVAVKWPSYIEILNPSININIQQVIFEEFVFRSMLWMFLSNLNLKSGHIIFIQAILFWLLHHFYSASSPITFWVYLPFQSLIYGIIVWRSNSITPGFVAHLANNLLAVLVR